MNDRYVYQQLELERQDDVKERMVDIKNKKKFLQSFLKNQKILMNDPSLDKFVKILQLDIEQEEWLKDDY